MASVILGLLEVIRTGEISTQCNLTILVGQGYSAPCDDDTSLIEAGRDKPGMLN